MNYHTRTSFALALMMSFVGTAFAQLSAEPGTLFKQLQSPEATDKATETLLKSAPYDPETRRYLQKELPSMIEKGWRGDSPQWMNAVSLAGKLKIAETAPALAKWIGMDSVGDTSLRIAMRLENNPAANALAEIGDPAIPELVGVLDHGSSRERTASYMILVRIDSPRAKSVIRARLPNESDSDVREFIEKLDKK
jgi:hypothetical protein